MDEEIYGLKGIGSKEGDVLTAKDFLNLFKTDKVSDLISKRVLEDYHRKIKK